MKLFLDSSVVIAGCGRASGASRLVFEQAESQNWELLVSSYVLSEVTANLAKLSTTARDHWGTLRPRLTVVPDILTFPWITIFSAAKDRPILFTAAAWSDVLLTLDRHDFAELVGINFYTLPILTPGDFIRRGRNNARSPARS